MQPGDGERLHAAQRKRFWLIVVLLMGIGLAAGFVGGFAVGFAEKHGSGVDPWMNTAGAAGVILVALLAAWGSWRFFVSVDELEVADNLWGSLFGFYTYAILFPAWWALHKLERAAQPDHWFIYGASMVVAVAVYGLRKWQQR